MYDRILFPTDGSDVAEEALEDVLDLAAAFDATVHLLYVADTTRDSVTRVGGTVVDALEQAGRDVLEDASDRCRERGVAVETELLQGEPHGTIVDYADEVGVGLIVMPTHGRSGLDRFLLGSTTERVVRQSDVPVLTFKPDQGGLGYPYEDVLVATDGSDYSRAALEMGVDVTVASGGDLHLLSVVDVGSLGIDAGSAIQAGSLEENARDIVDEAAGLAREAGIGTVHTSVGTGTSVPGAIRTYVRDNDVDLLVLGTHGRTGFDRYVLGSVSEQLVRTASVPVLTVRP